MDRPPADTGGEGGPLPVLEPVATLAPDPRGPRGARGVILLAAATGLLAAGASVASLFRTEEGPPHAPWLFPPGAHGRVTSLRDRLVAGLLRLQRPEGHFSAQPDGAASDDPLNDTEATGMGVAALSCARRMGSGGPALEEGLARAKVALLRRQQTNGGFGQSAKPGRGAEVAATAVGLIALSLDGNPVAGPAITVAGRHLIDVSTLGPLPGGWVQGADVRALWQLLEDGRLAVLGPDPLSAVPTRDVGTRRDAGEARVSEAFAQTLRRRLGAASTLPEEIFAKVMGDPPRWDGPRTDVSSWLLSAWLAARVPGGEAWFARALQELEKAVAPDGTVPWEAYGSPVSKTATGLLILWEGSGLRPEPLP